MTLLLVAGPLLALPAVPASTLARFTDASAPAASLVTDTLAPPTGLTAAGGLGVALAWTPTVDTYAGGYTVLRAPSSGGPYTTVATITPRTVVATTDSPGLGTWSYVLRSTFQSWSSADSSRVSATVGTPTTTAYAACTTTAADTAGAGDNDGYQTNPTRACTSDDRFAQDGNSGTGGAASCADPLAPAAPLATKDRHRFWGFATGVPASTTAIMGIQVRADLRLNNNGGSTALCVQLSGDAGATWTTIKSVVVGSSSKTTYTFGGAADLWGATWTPARLGTSQFRVRVIDASSQSNKRFDLDYLAVRVTYVP